MIVLVIIGSEEPKQFESEEMIRKQLSDDSCIELLNRFFRPATSETRTHVIPTSAVDRFFRKEFKSYGIYPSSIDYAFKKLGYENIVARHNGAIHPSRGWRLAITDDWLNNYFKMYEV